MTESADKHRYAVIVYPEEAGTLLAPEFHKQGTKCIGIIPQKATNQKTEDSSYHHIIYHDGEMSTLYATLSRHRLLCVLPGSEKGVPIADKISDHFDLLSNDSQHAKARYDKSCMAETVSMAGLRIPEQTTVTSETQLNALLAKGVHWPVILKPANSMGSENVNLCSNAQELNDAFHSIFNTRNRLARLNNACILQKYLTGTEYAIDTVSYSGCHKVVAVWEYQKSTTDIIGVVPFTSKRLLCEASPVQEYLMDYAYRLLDALGIRHGPAHIEMVIENGDVLLMEIGARLHGGLAAMQMSKTCIGQSQAEICGLAFTNPKWFLNNQSAHYKLSSFGEIVILIPPFPDMFINHACLDKIRNLPSAVMLNVGDKKNQPLGEIAGLVQLIHDDAQIIEDDLKSIRRFERGSLYQNAANPC